MPEDISAQDIARLSEAVLRPSIRKSFAKDPLAALERAGIDPRTIPAEAIDVLAELSEEDLEVLARVNERAALRGVDRARATAGDTVGYFVF